ncbi:MAG TPA: ABC transporter permease, partial [Gemmatimonadaceae bacterium]
MLTLTALRHAARRLARTPSFAGATVFTLALGIGGAAAVFTVVNGVLLRPLPYPRADRLVDLSHTLAVSGLTSVDQSDATYLLYRADNHVFTDVGIYKAASVNMHALTASFGDAAPQRLAAAFATPSVFHVLDATSARGRGFTDADAELGAPPVVVISQGLWKSTFGADPAIVGRHITVDGMDREIVGVMPPAFHFPTEQTALWLPLMLDAAHTNSAAFDYRGIARLRDGATIAAATADLQRLLPQVPVVYPGRLSAAAIAITKMQAVVLPLRDVTVGSAARILWIVLGAVGMLLLIACANVANLFLARAEGRQREFAVRRALGAGRGLLLQDALGEALIIAAIGGALGIACAAAGVGLLQRLPMGATIPRLDEVHVDGFVIAFTFGVSTLAAVIVSALPAVRAGHASLASLLTADGRTTTGTRARHRARRALVVSQVALALVLVAGAALFARSFRRLSAVNPGFDAQHALAFRLALPEAAFPTTPDAATTVANTLRALRALPDVRSVGVATKLPLDQEAAEDSAVFIGDHPTQPGKIPDVHPIVFATPSYFDAMGIPLVTGRLFAPPDPSLDPASAPREVVVSEAFAQRYWPDAAGAIGKRIRLTFTDPWSTIVGVVGSTRDDGLEKAPTEVVYSQLITSAANGRPWTPRDVAFVVRGGAGSTSVELASGIRTAV